MTFIHCNGKLMRHSCKFRLLKYFWPLSDITCKVDISNLNDSRNSILKRESSRQLWIDYEYKFILAPWRKYNNFKLFQSTFQYNQNGYFTHKGFKNVPTS